MSSLIAPEERVLSTLNADGSRRWLDPKPVEGFFRHRRRIVGWILIVIFMILPHLYWGGRQLFFINLADGEFTFFGNTFFRTDTLLLAFTAISIGVTVFLVTALFGRVWCGWACPQTVYLEFVFRPITRLFDGKGNKGLRGVVSKLPKFARWLGRWGLTALVCFHLSNTFLAYFVGSRTVMSWSLAPPWEHPLGFGFVLFVTFLMLVNFGFFREQICFIACPYGRFQSVLLDRQSLIVGYDKRRGEPRGKPRRKNTGKAGTPANPDVSLKVLPDVAPIAVTGAPVNAATRSAASEPERLGDCVDCTRCVQVCPTGIDIRDGLQLECIHCARCIDACDEVMTKLGRDPGLIRYSSQAALTGESKRFFRARIIVYPLILMVVVTGALLLAATRAPADVRLIRDRGQPYYTLPTGEISNQVRLRITNRTSDPRTYTVTTDHPGLHITTDEETISVQSNETHSVRLLLVADREALAGAMGVLRVPVTLTDDEGNVITKTCKFLGPMNIRAGEPTPAQTEPGKTEPDTPAPATAEPDPEGDAG